MNRRLTLSLQILVSEAATQTVAAVAIFFLKLDERLTVGSTLHFQTTLAPHARDVIALGTQLFQKVEGAVAPTFVHAVAPIGKEHGHDGIDDEQSERRRRQMLGHGRTGGTEGVVRLPIGCDAGGKYLAEVVYGLAVE